MTFSHFTCGRLVSGEKVRLYTVRSEKITFSALNLGCSLVSLFVKDKTGNNVDVVLGFPSPMDYASNFPSFGSVIGRFANKISGGAFTLEGKKYNLTKNFAPDTLHGGFPRWESEIFKVKRFSKKGEKGLRFTKIFPDGYQGFPGNLKVQIEYSVSGTDFKMTIRAETDRKTPLSITNHTYWNLSGHGSIKNHVLKLFSDKYLETKENNIPTGKILNAAGTVYDFSREEKLDSKLSSIEHGFDTTYVTDAFDEKDAVPYEEKEAVLSAEVYSEESGINMKYFTNQESFQLYTSGFLKFVSGKRGELYMPFSGICFEGQSFPDSVNQKAFPPSVLEPGKKYFSRQIFSFSIRN